jgi:hypothetical protein
MPSTANNQFVDVLQFVKSIILESVFVLECCVFLPRKIVSCSVMDSEIHATPWLAQIQAKICWHSVDTDYQEGATHISYTVSVEKAAIMS